jgi:alcohol dehydrogenase class IV
MGNQNVYFEVFGCCIEFGWQSLNTLVGHVKRFGAKKALIVTDEGVASIGIPERISSALVNAGIDTVTFKDILPNPSDKNVQNGADAYKAESCDLIIGVGGGSPMDAARAMRVLVSHSGPLHEYYGAQGAEKIINPLPPFVAIPTTSGTGSETSGGAIITNTASNTKCVVRGGFSTLALVDPELTIGMPSHLTAATGMDALSHHIEALLSHQYHPAAEGIALEGIRLVAENMIDAVENGQNREARTNMAMASTMGSLAFRKGLGVTHSLAHQLSTEYDVHHGVANAILLPHTMAFNREVAEAKLTRIAFAMGEKSPTPEGAIQAVDRLNKSAGLPTKLSEVNVVEAGIPIMARNAMDDWCHANNPRPCSESDMAMLFRKAL